jgi:hypothetical protein
MNGDKRRQLCGAALLLATFRYFRIPSHEKSRFLSSLTDPFPRPFEMNVVDDSAIGKFKEMRDSVKAISSVGPFALSNAG